jgi:signal transduction protein with GAF and PtsI domain
MTPSAIPEVKDLLRRSDRATLRRAADDAIAADSADEARRRISAALD